MLVGKLGKKRGSACIHRAGECSERNRCDQAEPWPHRRRQESEGASVPLNCGDTTQCQCSERESFTDLRFLRQGLERGFSFWLWLRVSPEGLVGSWLERQLSRGPRAGALLPEWGQTSSASRKERYPGAGLHI